MNKYEYTCEHCQHQLCTRRVPIFSTLDAEELGRVVNLIVRKQYVKGELIILEGSSPVGNKKVIILDIEVLEHEIKS